MCPIIVIVFFVGLLILNYVAMLFPGNETSRVVRCDPKLPIVQVPYNVPFKIQK
jgi:hypothetical protein